MASSTRSSTMSLARSWSSTMRSRAPRRASSASIYAELSKHEGRDVDDPRGHTPEPDGEHRNLGVAELERAVAASADVMAPAEVGELDPGGGRDDEVACVRVGQRAPGALERIRLREDVHVTGGLPALSVRREAKLFSTPPRNGLPAFTEEHDVRTVVEAAGQLPRLSGAPG